MAKSKQRKNHKQKVAARNTRIKSAQNQMKKYYANMQEYIKTKMNEEALKPKSGATETQLVNIEPTQNSNNSIEL